MNTTSSLSSGTGSGAQAATQNPQSATSTAALSGQAETVQTGTASSLLTSTRGIPLGVSSAATVPYASSTSTTNTSELQTTQSDHRYNPAILSVCIGLFVVAVIVFVVMNRTAKKTTV